MLEFKNFGVSIGNKTILKDVDFILPKGKLTVLLGANGSGKTTLLNAVIGMQPFSGKILLDGKDFGQYGVRERAQKVALFAQHLPMTGVLVKSLVQMGRNPYVGITGVLGDKDRQIVQSAMESALVTAFAQRRVDSLSGGERQRAYLAMLLAQDSEMVLMDEPTTYLDMASKREMLAMMRDLVDQKGKTLLVVMHDLSDAVQIADHIVVLANGSCVFSGERARCLQENIIENTFSVKRCEAQSGEENYLFFV